jgi:hypothetical protein
MHSPLIQLSIADRLLRLNYLLIEGRQGSQGLKIHQIIIFL